MLKEFVEKIISLAPPLAITLPDGRQYSSTQLHRLEEPVPVALKVNTLGGLKTYFESEMDGRKLEGCCIHIESHSKVSIISPLEGPFLQRRAFLVAESIVPAFPFGRWIALEDFIISVQADFVPDESTALLLKIVGNLKDENIKTMADDGVTQVATVKTGVSMVAPVALPNPITLRPYRTFREVDQPASTFVFRMHGGPTCALFEADGKMWQLEAMDYIEVWLKERLPLIPIIA